MTAVVRRSPLAAETLKNGSMIQSLERVRSFEQGATLRHDDEHAQFWWKSLGPFLNVLLESHHYSHQQHRKALAFLRDVVAPNLGPRPDASGQPSGWRSFMTDDFSPVEFSWTWGDNERAIERSVRFSMEAIGSGAGTQGDPWNQAATFSLLSTMGRCLQHLDQRWFFQFSSLCSPSRGATLDQDEWPEHASLSSMFLAFELGESEPMVKGYLIPNAKSVVTGMSNGRIICDALTEFARKNDWHDLGDTSHILEQQCKNLHLGPFMVSMDCVVPSKSRLKVYLRGSDTSFSAVKQVMTMFEGSAYPQKGLEKLRQLWSLIFGLEDTFNDNIQLPDKYHQTAGMLYYVEVRPNSTKKTMKVYLPVKHYAKNDWSAAQGLTTYIRTQDKSQSKMCDKYLHALERICSHRSLESSAGLQTYISVAIKGEDLDITSYLNPEVYHPARVATTQQ